MSITTELSVRISNINYGGHLGHDQLISLLHQARLNFLATLGGDEKNCFGVGMIMRRLECDYLGEAFLDDVLTIEISVTGIRPSRFTLKYCVSCGDNHHPIARASTEMVAFDYENHKVMPLPDALKKALQLHFHAPQQK